VPLDADEQSGIAGPLDRFDNSVWSVSRDVQILSWLRNGLVMRAVDGGLGAACNRSQTATGFQRGVVNRIFLGFGPDVFLAMRRGSAGLGPEVLDERASQIDVEKLAPITDGQNGLLLGKGVLENGAISFVAQGVCGRGQTAIYGTIFAGIHVRLAAREYVGIKVCDQPPSSHF